jgi:hypothetical protein
MQTRSVTCGGHRAGVSGEGRSGTARPLARQHHARRVLARGSGDADRRGGEGGLIRVLPRRVSRARLSTPVSIPRCERGDSNPHVRRHRLLRPARLPIPPLSPEDIVPAPGGHPEVVRGPRRATRLGS